MRKIDITGQVFDRWTVLSEGPKNGRRIRWLCQCECGKKKSVLGEHLRSGRSKSCWECAKIKYATGVIESSLYHVWCSMRQRCTNPTAHNYKHYGARGITVCERWNDYNNFAADMGPRPEGKLSIDRIDNDSGYRPDNVRWADIHTQNRNRRGVRL